tara:strand:+ start:133 stop:1695 length:1563 start_codon:yes stop_codon:yes gene_type:complete
MKKKFKFIIILFLINILSSYSHALDSTCDSLLQSIKTNKLNLNFEELDYKKVTEPNYEFEYIYNKKTNDWKYLRNNSNNLILARINNEDEIVEIINQEVKTGEIEIGDQLIYINNKQVSNLDDDQIDLLLTKYQNLELNEKELDNLKFEFKNSKGEKIQKKASYVEHEGQAEGFVNVKIKNISDVDVKNNTFKGDLKLSVIWQIENLHELSKDYLLEPNNQNYDYWYCFFNPKEFEEMQIGEIFSEITNSVQQNENLIQDEYHLNISDMYYEYEIYEKEDRNFVEITHHKKGNFTFSNEYNLKAFPFDRQVLKIKIADLSRSSTLLRLSVDNWTELALQDFKSRGKILEWNIVDSYSKYYYEIDAVNSLPSSGVELVFEIERDFQYYLFKVIFPIILILLVSWSVFWIHPKELESKLTITIVCLLSLIAYNFVIDEDLPKLSYLTILDYVVLLSYVFATIPNFISIYSFEKYRSKKIIWKKVDRNSRIYGPLIYLILVIVIIIFNVSGNYNTSAFLGFLI